MDKFVRTTNVNIINRLRKILWESIYSDVSNFEYLSHHLHNEFTDDMLDIKFNFCDSSIILYSGYPLSTEGVSTNMNTAYRHFLDDVYKSGKLNTLDYEECCNNINMMFLITFIDDYHVRIGL